MEDEFDNVFQISALQQTHVKPLMSKIFELLPTTGNQDEFKEKHNYPLLNIDSKIFIAELIREKVYLMMGEEIPYTVTVIVDEIAERKKNNLTYIRARILTTHDRYKRMLIGAK